jgi:hypothetical protein
MKGEERWERKRFESGTEGCKHILYKGLLGRLVSILNVCSIYPLYCKVPPIIEAWSSRRLRIHGAKLMITVRLT